MSRRWHNPLPDWIEADLEKRPLRQGPRQTLQVIANFCDAPQPDAETCTLLVCFGGNKLEQAAGCVRSTFWDHLRLLIHRGYIVPLRINTGRLANVYGIPGQRCELDPFRARPGNPVQRWDREDTRSVRRLLSENRALAERANVADSDAIDSGAPRAPIADGKRPDSGRLASDDRTLPSLRPSSSTSAHKPSPERRESRERLNDDGVDRARNAKIDSDLLAILPDSASPDQIKRALRNAGVDGGPAKKFAFHPLTNPASVRDVLARVNGHEIRNPGGYVVNLMKDAIDRAYEVERERLGQLAEAERAARTEADEQLDQIPDAELTELVAAHDILRDLPLATIRTDWAFRPEVVKLLAARNLRR